MEPEKFASPSKGPEKVLAQVVDLFRAHQDLYPSEIRDLKLADLLKAETETPAPSGQAVTANRKPHPFDMRRVALFKNANVWHSRCLECKTNATTGLGHKEESTHETLDPLTNEGWQSVLDDACEDRWNVGTGYIEIVRDTRSKVNNAKIVGIHHQVAQEVHVVVEDDQYHQHYEIQSCEGMPKRFARFGELERLRAKFPGEAETMRSELIRFRQSTSLSRWYGYPDWLSAITAVEVIQMLDQHIFDWILNRCVPEFLALFLGAKVDDDSWKVMNEAFKKNIGFGNAFKSIAVNLPQAGLAVQIEKLGLASEQQVAWFENLNDPFSLRIVTGHGVPPVLAGIQIPGKLGATNETASAMAAYQALCIGPAQRSIISTLNVTLGDPKKNGGLGRKLGRGGSGPIESGAFAFKTIIEEVASSLMTAMSQGDQAGGVGAGRNNPMDTTSRMRTELPVEAARGRNLTNGVKS